MVATDTFGYVRQPPGVAFGRRLLKLERALVPTLDGAAELLVPCVVELELIPPQTAEPPEHLREHSSVEAQILLGRELAQRSSP